LRERRHDPRAAASTPRDHLNLSFTLTAPSPSLSLSTDSTDAPRALHAAALASRAASLRTPTALCARAPFAAILPGSSPVEAVLTSGLTSFLSLYNAAVVGRLILTWFPNPPQAIVGPLATVVDPYLNLFRGLLPPLGQIDLSPILAFVVLDLCSNAAAALPCEMPAEGGGKGLVGGRPPTGPGRAARRGLFRRRRVEA